MDFIINIFCTQCIYWLGKMVLLTKHFAVNKLFTSFNLKKYLFVVVRIIIFWLKKNERSFFSALDRSVDLKCRTRSHVGSDWSWRRQNRCFRPQVQVHGVRRGRGRGRKWRSLMDWAATSRLVITFGAEAQAVTAKAGGSGGSKSKKSEMMKLKYLFDSG